MNVVRFRIIRRSDGLFFIRRHTFLGWRLNIHPFLSGGIFGRVDFYKSIDEGEKAIKKWTDNPQPITETIVREIEFGLKGKPV